MGELMKRTSTVLMAILALATLFTFGAMNEAKAASTKADEPVGLGFTFDVLMADGGSTVEGKPACNLYSANGQYIGYLTVDLSTPGISLTTFTTNQGTLVIREHLDVDGWGADSVDGTERLAAGEITDIVSATGAFQHVTRVMHRCRYEINADKIPVKCINCLYAFLRD